MIEHYALAREDRLWPNPRGEIDAVRKSEQLQRHAHAVHLPSENDLKDDVRVG